MAAHPAPCEAKTPTALSIPNCVPVSDQPPRPHSRHTRVTDTLPVRLPTRAPAATHCPVSSAIPRVLLHPSNPPPAQTPAHIDGPLHSNLSAIPPTLPIAPLPPLPAPGESSPQNPSARPASHSTSGVIVPAPGKSTRHPAVCLSQTVHSKPAAISRSPIRARSVRSPLRSNLSPAAIRPHLHTAPATAPKAGSSKGPQDPAPPFAPHTPSPSRNPGFAGSIPQSPGKSAAAATIADTFSDTPSGCALTLPGRCSPARSSSANPAAPLPPPQLQQQQSVCC